MSDLRFCKDCKYHTERYSRFSNDPLAYCLNRKVNLANDAGNFLVDGRPEVFCSSERGKVDGVCGTDGKLWEEATP